MKSNSKLSDIFTSQWFFYEKKSKQDFRDTFLLYPKSDLSGGKSNGTDFFPEKLVTAQLHVRITTYEVIIENPAAMFVILND